jgi:acyl carrier protein/NAD(P)-dependent dehydrogenase (short-subunit alcohol dehydrogenase family)
MAEVTSSAKPAAAALVTGFDTPEGQSVAGALARMGYRVCVVCSDAAIGQVSLLPGHDRLRHEAIVMDLSAAGAAEAAASEAQGRLGHVTALVHVALPSAAADQKDGFDAAAFARQVQAGAGAFLGLAVGLLPGMLGTQTGCLSVLTEAPPEGTSSASGELGASASLGALLGAVRQIADRCEGTELRSIAFLSDADPRGNSRHALSGAATSLLGTQLGFERKPGVVPSGSFLRLAAPKLQGPIELLRLPPPAAPLQAQNGAHAPAHQAPSNHSPASADRLGQKLAQTFRSAFGLPTGVDVVNLAVADVKRWDSLGHLKLMMEVEQALRVRLPAEALSRIRSYRDLEKAVRAYLPAT